MKTYTYLVWFVREITRLYFFKVPGQTINCCKHKFLFIILAQEAYNLFYEGTPLFVTRRWRSILQIMFSILFEYLVVVKSNENGHQLW